MTAATDLVQRHRAQQLLLRKQTVAQMQALWPALDWTRLDATYPAFAVQVARQVQQNRQTSSGLAASYLRAFRKASGVPGEVKAVFAEPLIVPQFNTSLASTSIVALKRSAAAGIPANVALSNALTEFTGSMIRLVLNGGRETSLATMRADSAVEKWQRVLGGGGCGFCQMLAGRGAVYKEETADFAAHDHCACSVAPIYGGSGKSVKQYTPSARDIKPADRARVRQWLADHPNA